MKQTKLRLVWFVVSMVAMVLVIFKEPILDFVLTDTEETLIRASQINGGQIEVSVRESKRGFFIDGGHGFSLGSYKRSYEVIFNHHGKKIDWRGIGVPIILQTERTKCYLATFDRESDSSKATFKCYIWDESWKSLQQIEFPKHLAFNNLVKFGANQTSLPGDARFRTSLLAKFWFCISNEVPYWEVSDSMMEPNFIAEFQEKWLTR